MTSTKFKGVFFDAGNTLLRVHPSIGTIYSDVASLFGAQISSDAIEQSFKQLWTQTGPLVQNEGHRLSYEKERDWWKHIVNQVFREHIQFQDFDSFFDHLYLRFAEADCWRLYEEVEEVLYSLKERKVKLAIISNWDSRLPSLCDQLGITSFFDAVIVSSLVGYEKNLIHPFFQIALKETELKPEEAVYIGDDPYLDYQAAKKVGLHAFQLDRHDRFPNHPDRITSLRDLLELL